MSNKKHVDAKMSAQTILTHLGRSPDQQDGFVNTPVVRGSTVLFDNFEQLMSGDRQYKYGRHGNPTNDAVSDVITALEGAHTTMLAPSGLSAISTTLTAVAHAHDHILISDSAYEPTRQFCDSVLKANQVEVEYYDPRIGSGIDALIRENTTAILTESPGSLTFEVQDLPAIAAARGNRDIAIITDNSWATPLYYKPLELGADIVVHAGTKMFVGHSDVLFGTISTNEKWTAPVLDTYRALGVCVSPEDSFLVARGLRTLALRMKEHQQRALELAKWLETLPVVDKVFHPALEQHPDHEIFKRDFTGSGSLFGFTLKDAPQSAISAMLNDLKLFGMGYSWGGFESLILPVFIKQQRSATKWAAEGNLFRVHIGLEDMDDLKADLEAAISRYNEAAGH
ncbi:cystathionine beta-lyase [Maritalea sp.]|uniref:cystathionine beta-lyase n=1 Tax=Maritalea sp. TaxID=2003361 RepID=UPI003EF0BBB8